MRLDVQGDSLIKREALTSSSYQGSIIGSTAGGEEYKSTLDMTSASGGSHPEDVS